MKKNQENVNNNLEEVKRNQEELKKLILELLQKDKGK